MAVAGTAQRKRAASLQDLRASGRMVVHLDGHTICLLVEDGDVHAVDNRCPHMGFPLHRGSVADGILTCHWHHARFDLCTGGTFDEWADDLRRFPVEVEGDDVYVDLTPARGRARAPAAAAVRRAARGTSRSSWPSRRSRWPMPTRPASAPSGRGSSSGRCGAAAAGSAG